MSDSTNEQPTRNLDDDEIQQVMQRISSVELNGTSYSIFSISTPGIHFKEQREAEIYLRPTDDLLEELGKVKVPDDWEIADVIKDILSSNKGELAIRVEPASIKITISEMADFMHNNFYTLNIDTLGDVSIFTEVKNSHKLRTKVTEIVRHNFLKVSGVPNAKYTVNLSYIDYDGDIHKFLLTLPRLLIDTRLKITNIRLTGSPDMQFIRFDISEPDHDTDQ